MIKYRYNAAEKFRIQSINLLRKERQRIIEEEENNIQTGEALRNGTKNMSKTIGIGGWSKGMGESSQSPSDDKMEQILSDQKKAIQKIKQKQRNGSFQSI